MLFAPDVTVLVRVAVVRVRCLLFVLIVFLVCFASHVFAIGRYKIFVTFCVVWRYKNFVTFHCIHQGPQSLVVSLATPQCFLCPLF